MEWIVAEARKAASPRTYLLACVLALALLWAIGEKAAPKRRPAQHPTAAAAGARPPASFSEPTPAGWGRDPFDPRAVASNVNDRGR